MLTAAMGISVIAPVSAFAADDEFAAAVEASFAVPEMSDRPYARWWLAEGSHTDETLRESVKELYESGFGGVEFVTLTSEAEVLDDATYGWGLSGMDPRHQSHHRGMSKIRHECKYDRRNLLGNCKPSHYYP